VKPQGTVQAFDVLCEVQSDKASVEITSPFDGVVKELLVQEGEVAKVGSGLCLIEIEEEGDEPSRSEESAEPKPPSSNSNAKADAPEPKPTKPSSPRRPHPLDPSNPPDAATILGDLNSASAVPSVRHFARQNGIFDLSKLTPGSGKNGRIEKKDVEAYLAGQSSGDIREKVTTTVKEDTIVELGRTRYSMWKAMTKVLVLIYFTELLLILYE
jgi:2-oxoisovalerate dehydrogenase E2 component (dihydrolipoyl transacylase)